MNAFEEFMFDEKYVLRFYRIDNALVCSINESMVSELRHIESKIRQLKDDLSDLQRHIPVSTKPVAYINKDDGLVCAKCFNPLYTYPVKELTDKEILEEWDWDSGEILATDLLDFADAILRKAQEK